MSPLNTLIPTELTIVILDTNPVRNLAHSNECPTWVKVFEDMSQNGYSFSLADGTFAELANQIKHNKISKKEAARMLRLVEMFLNPNLRIFPGKCDIIALLGATATRPDWSVGQVRDLVRQCWEKLKLGEELNSNDLLDEERQNWFALFDKLQSLVHSKGPLDEYESPALTIALTHSVEKDTKLSPPLSVRSDLQIRLLWRQYVRSLRKNKAYNPQSPRKINDGIDFDLYNYFLLPAFVVTIDRGCLNGLTDIKSFQKQWFWQPEKLALSWQRGEYPRPTWPTS